MDAAGILVNAGYQCCDFWENSGYGRADACTRTPRSDSGAICATTRASSASSGATTRRPRPRRRQALNGFAAADFPGPFISSAEYNSSPQLGTSGREGGALRLGSAELLVRHLALPVRRLDADQRGRLVGLRQRAERGQHRADAGLDQPLPVRLRPVRAVADAEREPVPQQLRGHEPHRLRLRHALQPRHRDHQPLRRLVQPGAVRRGGAGRRTTRTPARSSRPSSTTRPTPRSRPPAPSTGS